MYPKADSTTRHSHFHAYENLSSGFPMESVEIIGLSLYPTFTVGNDCGVMHFCLELQADEPDEADRCLEA